MDKDQKATSHETDHSISVSGDNNNNSSQATNGRLSIKFKIPRTEIGEEKEEEEEENSPPLVNSSVRVCPECGKSFNSGKALGGHRRSHVQAKLKAQKMKKAVEGSGLDATNEAGGSMQVSKPCTCSLCHRTFPSVKSLFGHMKSHPERDWRGIQPPQGEKQSALDTIVLDNQIDCSVTVRPVVNLRESLKGWAVKAKRGRGSLVGSDYCTYLEGGTAEEEEVEKEMEDGMQEAVHDLLLLAEECFKDFEGGTRVEFSPDDNGYGFDSSSGYGRNLSTGTLTIEEKRPTRVNNSSGIVRVRMEKGKGKALVVPGFDSEDSMSSSHDSEETDRPMEDYEDDYNEVESTRKMNKKRKLADLEKVGEIPSLAQDQSPTRHICSICSKSFPSHQALGGHKASHNKPKKIHTTTEDEKQVSEESAGGSRVAAAVSGEHKCNICNEIFPTGMALGGHKRRHWTAPVEAPSSSSQGTSSPTEVTQMTPRVCGFDLNEPAPEDDDDVQDIQPVSGVPGEASAVMLQN